MQILLAHVYMLQKSAVPQCTCMCTSVNAGQLILAHAYAYPFNLL